MRSIDVNFQPTEKPSNTSAPIDSNKNRTHPRNRSPSMEVKLQNYDEPIIESSRPSKFIPNDYNQKPITNTNSKEPKQHNTERRTVMRETTFEKADQTENSFLIDDTLKKSLPQNPEYTRSTVKSDIEVIIRENERPDQMNIETIVTSSENDNNSQPRRHSKPKTPTQPVHEIKKTTNDDEKLEELFIQTKNTKQTKNVNEEFLNTERKNLHPSDDETLDGAFISKSPEMTPNFPTYNKKGVSHRETFEERCRHILGMENDGDTQGKYQKHPEFEEDTFIDEKPNSTNVPKGEVTTTTTTTTETITTKRLPTKALPKAEVKDEKKKPNRFEVKVEDCDDDDEPLSINNIKESLKTQDRIKTNEKKEQSDSVEVSRNTSPQRKSPGHSSKSPSPERRRKPLNIAVEENKRVVKDKKASGPKILDKNFYVDEVTTVEIKTRPVKSVESKLLPDSFPVSEDESPVNDSDVDVEQKKFVSEKIIKCNGKARSSISESPDRKKSEPSTLPNRKTIPNKKGPKTPSEPQTEQPSVTRKTPKKSIMEIGDEEKIDIIENVTTSSIKTSVTKGSTKQITGTKNENLSKTKPVNKHPKQPSSETTTKQKTNEPTIRSRQSRKPSTDSTTSTIKDRLRSSPRKQTQTKDDVDASTSSEASPTRNTEQRRSSNISVRTEIIIDHVGPKSPESSPKKQLPSPKRTTTKDLIENISPEKLNRKLLVTERKESAPVPRVTRRDKDVKMSRSTSENVIKTNPNQPTHSDMSTLGPDYPSKTVRRSNKCFTTKTINLTSTERIINSEDMENVIIDIQQAKSSREPSPDKIVPTPVPVGLDTGKPRYPDVVQEPEDEPKKKPTIKNIPIFEEEANDYVGCHISEVKIEKTTKSTEFGDDQDHELDNPTVEAPQSLEYSSLETTNDESLLSVHEKVSKFSHTAEELKKPKASSPFNREFDNSPTVEDDDDCLLTVDEKVTKFLKTAESITKNPITPLREIERPNFDDVDEELRQDECTLSVSQKIHKFKDTADKLAPTAPQKSPQLVARMERHISRQSEPDGSEDKPGTFVTENVTIDIKEQNQFTEDSQKPTVTINGPEESDKEPGPMTKSHTNSIEMKRQKDILSRPSVFSVPSGKKTTPTDSKKSTVFSKTEEFKNMEQTHTERNITRSGSPNKEDKNKPSVKPALSKDAPKETPKYNDRNEFTTYQTSRISKTKSRFDSTQDNKPKVVTDHSKTSQEPNSIETQKSKNDEDCYETSETETEETIVYRPENVSKPDDYVTTRNTRRTSQKSENIDHEESTQKKMVKTEKISHSPTRNTPNKSTKTTVTKITENTIKHTPHSKHSDTEIIEPLLDQPTSTKHTPIHTGRSRISTDTVATRRNIFEKEIPTKLNKTSQPYIPGRRPSYMDHTKSSLEHTRRDSLEINKSNYSRKVSEDDIQQYERRPNTAVKFDVPQKSPKDTVSEDINVEEIFDLNILEELLEIVTSYEIRRRIRAQIRLVKKNMLNKESTDKTKTATKTATTTSSTIKSTVSSSTDHYKQRDNLIDDKTIETRRSIDRRSHTPSKMQYEETTTIITDQTKSKPRDRSHSPDAKTISSSLKEVRRTSGSQVTTNKNYSLSEQVDYSTVVVHSPKTERKYPTEMRSSPDCSRKPQTYERSYSPQQKPTSSPSGRHHSPEIKTTSPTRNGKILVPSRDRSISPKTKSVRQQQQQESHSTVKTTTRSSFTSPDRKSPKIKPDDKTPIWVDRTNILKSSTTRKAPTSPTTRTSATKTTKSFTQRQSKTKEEDDSIISSYGIGPTDENGLPLFGIKALKKKKLSQPCETTEEVTGYVIEEKYYSDNKTKPIKERKELIYSTNADELENIKKKVKNTKEDDVEVVREFKKIDKGYEPSAITSGGNDFPGSPSTKYVRRGSVKEMSEKFIHKESSQSITEKSNGYPKAGLILRTNSRLGSIDGSEPLDLNSEKFTKTTTEVSHHRDDDSTEECENITRRSSHTVAESESDCESFSMQREVNKRTSSSSTRSFLNTSGESRVVTDVGDVLERMRNADNVVEEGDTTEDQEARALLNKFLGASVIMRGVETMMPSSKQTKTVTSYSNDDQDDLRKQEVKTTRITKTIKSGSSSSPVTRATCDIEEIWDEEILKQLLEEAKTYEERRKIRSRLREIMAEREEQHSTSTTEKTETKEKDGAIVTTTTKVTTRTVTGGTAPKPVSPFAKFRQLDKQNSQQKMSK